MDPVTALSVACGVIQIVDAGLKTSKLAYEVYTSSSGASAENAALEERTKALAAFLQRLKTSAVDTPNTVSAAKKQLRSKRPMNSLQTASAQCQVKATELLEVLNGLKIETSQSRLRKTIKSLRVPLKRGKVKDLQHDLEALQRQVELYVIADIRQSCIEASKGTLDGLDQLSAEQQATVKAIASCQSSIEVSQIKKKDIRDIVRTSAASTKQLIQAEGQYTRLEISRLERNATKHQAERDRHALIESFAFDGMFQREASIHEAAHETYRWIFEDDPKISIDSFTEWLKGNEPLYWISGKPGSGKSTLMNYIWGTRFQDRNDILAQWCGDRRLVTASVFFWNPGHDMQKSVAGMLRTLLYQVFKDFPALLDNVEQRSLQPVSVANPWNETNLKAILKDIIKQDAVRFCFFIDGLDEYGDGRPAANRHLMSFLQTIVSSSTGNMKCCLSSRPMKAFEDVLSNIPHLAMEAVNRADIERYVVAELGQHLDSDTIQRVIGKARGVFLWVSLAVQSLLSGVDAEDTREQLRDRLEQLPEGIEALFSHMLSKIDQTYLAEVAVFFRIAELGEMSSKYMSVCELVFALQAKDYVVGHCQWSLDRVQSLRHSCDRLMKRIRYCTCGLIEVDSSNRSDGRLPYYESPDPIDNRPLSVASEDHAAVFRYLYTMKIRMTHRTVLEFLKSRGKHLLAAFSLGQAYEYFITSYAVFISLDTSLRIFHEIALRNHCFHCLSFALVAERDHGFCPTEALDTLNDFAASYLSNGNWIDDARYDETYYATDFVSLCAEYLLCGYIRGKINHQRASSDADAVALASHLLRCVTACGLSERQNPITTTPQILGQEHAAMIRLLLEHGANPTAEARRLSSLGTMTAFEGFIGCIGYYALNPGDRYVPVGETSNLKQPLRRALELLPLFEHFPVNLDTTQCHNIMIEGHLPNDRRSSFVLKVQCSARILLQLSNRLLDSATDEIDLSDLLVTSMVCTLPRYNKYTLNITEKGSQFVIALLKDMWRRGEEEAGYITLSVRDDVVSKLTDLLSNAIAGVESQASLATIFEFQEGMKEGHFVTACFYPFRRTQYRDWPSWAGYEKDWPKGTVPDPDE